MFRARKAPKFIWVVLEILPWMITWQGFSFSSDRLVFMSFYYWGANRLGWMSVISALPASF